MLTGLFGWLRRAAKAAVLGGVQDALDEIASFKADEPERPRLTYTPKDGKGPKTKG